MTPRARRFSYLVLLLFSAWSVQTVVVGGTDWASLGSIRAVLKSGYQFLKLDPSGIPKLFAPALETLCMASAGTLLGLLAAPVLIWVGKPHRGGAFARAASAIGQTFSAFSAAVHEIIWALILISALGAGNFAGTLALGLRSMGMIAYRAADTAEPGKDDRTSTHKGARLHSWLSPSAFARGVIHEWGRNIGRAAVLGLVGAGGLGYCFYRELVTYNYNAATAVLLAVLALIAGGRMLCHYAEQAIDGVGISTKRAPQENIAGVVTGRSAKRGMVGRFALMVIGGLLLYSPIQLQLSAMRFTTLLSGFEALLDPDGQEWTLLKHFNVDLAVAMVHTVQMALLASLLGLMLAVALDGLGTVHMRRRRFLGPLTRASLALFRIMPAMFLALVFVAIFGVGPLSGVLSLAFASAGYVGCWFVHRAERASAKTVGSPLQGLWAQVHPGNSPIAFQACNAAFRNATVIGLFGAGGIGWELKESLLQGQSERTVAVLAVMMLLMLIAYASETKLCRRYRNLSRAGGG
ncbi:MAG: PhnE/PtxC family ABC transporter permease [Gammaproteobacteria bacterium]